MYDIVLTYSREIQLIWGSRWTFVRILFTVARYLVPCILTINLAFTFHPNLTAQSCRIEIRMMAALGIFANATMMCILLLRVWAVWGRKPWMLAVLLLVFVSSQLPPALTIGKTIQKLDVIDNPLPGLITGCVTTSSSSASTHWVQLFISSLTDAVFAYCGSGLEPQSKGSWHPDNGTFDTGRCLVLFGSDCFRWSHSGRDLNTKDADGSSAFSVFRCDDIVYMLSVTPPTSWVLYPHRSKHAKRSGDA
ncbi:unnamed protein product [Rhizoctonia solani]|uniref:DUF6533 domain-containing protein n=1 Tax=Rhizoctonia solani TaxID=456999 RepID=A0A8H3CDM4_9AGAM|nr:unnamed protein product [Rhizoctonia solani]